MDTEDSVSVFTLVFSTSNVILLENGGVYAVPNPWRRQYGEDWHNLGVKMKKQNVFDDFIAAGAVPY